MSTDALRSSLERVLTTERPPVEPLGETPLVVYGAGNCGRAVAARAGERGVVATAFIDGRADELREIDGLPCHSPGSAEARRLAALGAAAVVAIFNFATDVAPVRQRLHEIGFRRIISYPEFHELYGDAPDFWLTKRSFYTSRAAEILDGFELFEDEQSRKVFRDCIAQRVTDDPALLREPDSAHQYLPPDLPRLASPMRLIDGGAFTGDSLALFLQNGATFEAVAAFEPDLENYRQLCATIAGAIDRLGTVTTVPCAVADATGMLSFRAGAGAASTLGAEGATNIQAVALDDILPNFAPTFLKLDIEGAEPLALQGAKNLIRKYQPRLAVCVYHVPDHLWTIPKLIRALEPRYRLALRYHQWNGFDVVAYAYTA